jgi:hypothetical protein
LAKFQVWLSQAFKIGYIFSAKVLVNFISALGCRACRDIGQVFLQRFWHVVFWFLLKIKVRAIILSFMAVVLVFNQRVLRKSQPTKRAPDAGDSAQISSSFLRLFIFPA